MNKLIRWGVKKYILKIVNKVLSERSNSVYEARVLTERYIAKFEAAVAFLRSFNRKIADNLLTSDEVDAITDEALALAKEMTE
jgi:hypothetical protein